MIAAKVEKPYLHTSVPVATAPSAGNVEKSDLQSKALLDI